MARGPLTLPRKTATQGRSRATVDALVEATARILVREGFDRASTNRIAEAAGVSVGSLYQYFPGKEALVAAVIARHNRQLRAIGRRALAEVADLPLAAAVRTLVAAGIEGHRVDPDLHRVLAEQTPHIGAAEAVGALGGETYDLFRAWLDRHRAEIRPADLDLAAFVCVTSIEALTQPRRGAAPAGRAVGRGGRVAGRGGATRLVLGYLQ